jgi:hypothetical protein
LPRSQQALPMLPLLSLAIGNAGSGTRDTSQIGSVRLTKQLAASSTKPEIKVNHQGRYWHCNVAFMACRKVQK